MDDIRFHPGFDWAIIPDVIDGTEDANRLLLERWPFGRTAGVPVWHLHESISWLRFLAGAYPRIALGSSGIWATPGTPSWWRRINEVMAAITDGKGRPMTKLHGLRMLNTEIFRRLPLASADSTNAVRNGNLVTRFGTYCPPTLGQRQQVIADRIEAEQSAAVWKPANYMEGVLWDWPGREESTEETRKTPLALLNETCENKEEPCASNS